MGSDGIELYRKIADAYDRLFDRLAAGDEEHRKAIEAEYEKVCFDPAPEYVELPPFNAIRSVKNIADGQYFLESLDAFNHYCQADDAKGVSICGYKPGPYILASTYSRFLDDGRRCPIGTLGARPEVVGAIRLDKAKGSHGLNEARRLLGLKCGDPLKPWATDGGLDKYDPLNVSIVDRSRLFKSAKTDFQKLMDGMPKKIRAFFGPKAMSNVLEAAKIKRLTEIWADHLRRAYAGGNRNLARRIDNDVKLITRLAYKVKDIDTAKAMVKWALSQYALALHCGLLIDAQIIILQAVKHLMTDWKPEQPIEKGYPSKPKPKEIKIKQKIAPGTQIG